MSDDFDVSLIVNIHNGCNTLARTLMSLEEAAGFAQEDGLRCELVFVLDRSSLETSAWAEAYRSTVWADMRIITCDNGSLGLSRNDGARAARGRFVMLCDEDDLVSYNSISSFFNLASACGPRTVLIPHYLFGFGKQSFLAEYQGSDLMSPLAFITSHPYLSRLFFSAELMQEMTYIDVRLSEGYAYEDWHFNAALTAAGIAIRSAPNTILFYRQTSSGLLQDMNAASTRQIPPNPLFEPTTYLRICADAFRLYERDGQTWPDAEAIRTAFTKSQVCLELCHAANRIDPAIGVADLENTPILPNRSASLRRGAAYYRACQAIGSRCSTDTVRFKDVFVLSALDTLDGSKMRTRLESMLRLDPTRRILLLLGGLSVSWTQSSTLPEAVCAVHLLSLETGLEEEDADVIALRLIESTGVERLHLGSNPFARKLFSRFKTVLKKRPAFFYRLGSAQIEHEGLLFSQGDDFNFASEHADGLCAVVVEEEACLKADQRRLDRFAQRWHHVPLGDETAFKAVLDVAKL